MDDKNHLSLGGGDGVDIVPHKASVDGVLFCNQCHILIWNYKDIFQHLHETSHDVFCASLSQEYRLICVMCRESFASMIELKEHRKMSEGDHCVFKRIARLAPPLEQEDQAVLEVDEQLEDSYRSW